MTRGRDRRADPGEVHALDELIHSRIRLGAMAILASVEDAEFTYLRDRLKATDGNLSTHMRRLEEAGYIEVRKEFVDRKPVTRYRLSPRGRRAFREYVERMERILQPGAGAVSDGAGADPDEEGAVPDEEGTVPEPETGGS